MVKFCAYNDDENDWISGGTAVIGQWNNLGNFDVPSSDYNGIAFYVKAYNNLHPNWNDSYYNDATQVATKSVSLIAGKTVKVTVQGASSATVVIE